MGHDGGVAEGARKLFLWERPPGCPEEPSLGLSWALRTWDLLASLKELSHILRTMARHPPGSGTHGRGVAGVHSGPPGPRHCAPLGNGVDPTLETGVFRRRSGLLLGATTPWDPVCYGQAGGHPSCQRTSFRHRTSRGGGRVAL